MAAKSNFNTNMRVIHRYLGFFLAGIMAVYSISGIILIFRDTDFLKKEKHITKNIKPDADEKALSQLLKMKEIKVKKTEGDIMYFEEGTYNKATGHAAFVKKEMPFFINKMMQIHKAKSGDPLYFLNVFFGVSLLFFVISSFWMFMPKTGIFKKGIYYTIAGILLTLFLLFL